MAGCFRYRLTAQFCYDNVSVVNRRRESRTYLLPSRVGNEVFSSFETIQTVKFGEDGSRQCDGRRIRGKDADDKRCIRVVKKMNGWRWTYF